MSSKELLEHLARLKIPAKNHASTLVEAYVDKIRKDLADVISERQVDLEEERLRAHAEEEARIAEERAKREAAEAEIAALDGARKAAEETALKAAQEATARAASRAALAEAQADLEAPAPVTKEAAPTAAPVVATQEEAPGKVPAPPEDSGKRRRAELEAALKSETERLAREEAERQAAAAAEAAERAAAREAAAERRRQEASESERASGAEQKAAEERERLAREAAALEAAEADRYRRMAREAEAVQSQGANIISEAAKMVQSASDRKKKKTKKPSGRRENTGPVVRTTETKPVEAPSGAISIPRGYTVAQFAEAVGVTPGDVVRRLMLLGDPHTVNQPMSPEAVEIVAEDIGVEVKMVSAEEEQGFSFVDREEDLRPRPPVVTVMGHVDHGKTSLLDAIRETGVAETEAGGITQHIGASLVRKGDRQITFIDTPGHEAFTAMRARGAKVTDIAILVVAADDGVKPQTVEAIHHAKAAGVPIIVAVNKIDKDGANPDQVRQMLTEHEIVPEEWGGSTIFVNVSAKKRIGIEDLLEMILLQADVLELKANPDALASGSVVEAKLDKGRGPVATVLVARGTLHVGDSIVAGTTYGRVRALIDPKGNTVVSAKPADPVEVLGLSSVPSAGDEFRVFADERDARDLAEDRALRQRLLAQERQRHVSLDDLFSRIQEGALKDLNLVVKADVQGSIEALQDALDKMKQDEVRINVIHSGVGGITESDVMLASASDAIIIGFNVRPLPEARDLADREKVDMRMYRVIYQAIEEINAARVGMLSPTIEEQTTAHVEVRELFKVPKIGTIAGCLVQEGEISRDDSIRLVRNATIIHDGRLHSLRRFKDDVKSVKAGYECGIGIENFQDIKVGDTIEAYRTIEVAREE